MNPGTERLPSKWRLKLYLGRFNPVLRWDGRDVNVRIFQTVSKLHFSKESLTCCSAPEILTLLGEPWKSDRFIRLGSILPIEAGNGKSRRMRVEVKGQSSNRFIQRRWLLSVNLNPITPELLACEPKKHN